MEGVRPRVRVDRATEAGATVEVKTLISHPMESGQRRDGDGNTIPRQIINRFTAEFNGEMVIDVTIEPAVSTNPYCRFLDAAEIRSFARWSRCRRRHRRHTR